MRAKPAPPAKLTKRAKQEAPPVIRKPVLEKRSLHPRNRHRGRYDFVQLVAALPALKEFLIPNPFNANEWTIDFANPESVMALNAALLKASYAVESWRIPPGYLCPPIPGRADYVHFAADLLANRHTQTSQAHLYCAFTKTYRIDIFEWWLMQELDGSSNAPGLLISSNRYKAGDEGSGLNLELFS